MNGTTLPSRGWIGRCITDDGEHFPAFIDVDFVGPPAPEHYQLTHADIRRGLFEALHQSTAVGENGAMRMNTGRSRHYHHPFAPSTIEVYPSQRRRTRAERLIFLAKAAVVAVLSFLGGYVLPRFWQ